MPKEKVHRRSSLHYMKPYTITDSIEPTSCMICDNNCNYGQESLKYVVYLRKAHQTCIENKGTELIPISEEKYFQIMGEPERSHHVPLSPTSPCSPPRSLAAISLPSPGFVRSDPALPSSAQSSAVPFSPTSPSGFTFYDITTPETTSFSLPPSPCSPCGSATYDIKAPSTPTSIDTLILPPPTPFRSSEKVTEAVSPSPKDHISPVQFGSSDNFKAPVFLPSSWLPSPEPRLLSSARLPSPFRFDPLPSVSPSKPSQSYTHDSIDNPFDDLIIPSKVEVGEFVLTWEIIPAATRMGKPRLANNAGYTFTASKPSKKGTLWRCSVRNKTNYCPVTVQQPKDTMDFQQDGRYHTHEPQFGAIQRSRVVSRLMKAAKEQPFKSALKLVNEEIQKEFANHDYPSFVLPNPLNLARTVNKKRQGLRPKKPQRE